MDNYLLNPDNYNPGKLDKKIKRGLKFLMEGMTTLIVGFVIVLILARAFFGIAIKDYKQWASYSDVILIVFYSLVVQNTLGIQGNKNGKRDEEYVEARHNYIDVRDRVREAGSPSLEEFCDQYINMEFEMARKSVLSETPIKYDVWLEHFEHLSPKEIDKLPKEFSYNYNGKTRIVMLSKKTKKRLCYIYKMTPVDTTPEQLLVEFANRFSRGGLPMTPERAIEREKKWLTAYTILSGIITGFIVWDLLDKFSKEALMAAIMTLMCVLYRGFMAYYRHYQAYSVKGSHYYNRQIEILMKYEAWFKNQRAVLSAPAGELKAIEAS